MGRMPVRGDVSLRRGLYNQPGHQRAMTFVSPRLGATPTVLETSSSVDGILAWHLTSPMDLVTGFRRTCQCMNFHWCTLALLSQKRDKVVLCQVAGSKSVDYALLGFIIKSKTLPYILAAGRRASVTVHAQFTNLHEHQLPHYDVLFMRTEFDTSVSLYI